MSLASSFAQAAALRPDSRSSFGVWTLDRGGWLVAALTWVLMLLMTVPDNFDYSSLNTGTPPESGSAASRLAWLLLLVLPVGVLVWRRALAWLLLRWVNVFLLAFCALAIASVLWSDAPAVTVRRFIRVASVLLCALAFVLLGWNARSFQRVLLPALTLLLAGSLVFGVLRPDLAIHQETSHELLNAWRGLTNNKNSLGDCASIGFIMWLHAWLCRETSRWKALAGVAIAGACLVLSRSSTSMVVTVLVSALLLLLCRAPLRWRPLLPPLIVTGMVVITLYSLVILRLVPGTDFLLKPLAAITGKDLSFTGRADIWHIIADHIHQQPWLGNGYGAYWLGPLPWAPVYRFIVEMNFYPGSAHSGYLEIVNDLGVAGLLCLLGYMSVYLRDALRLLRYDHPQGALFTALFAQQVIANLSETHWFSVMSADFVTMTFATTCIARQLLDRQLRRYFGEPQFFPDPYMRDEPDLIEPQASTP